MIHSLLNGIGFGFILTMMLGPVFFGLLQTSINKGFKFGVFFAIGVAFSDIAFILLTYFGISRFVENELFQQIIGTVGGIFMALFGLYYFFKPKDSIIPVTAIKEVASKANFLMKGFVINLFNPSVLFFWIGVVSYISVQYDDNKLHIITFFSASVCTVLTMDILKSYIANRIKKYFTITFLNVLNKLLGIVLFLLGIKLIYDSFIGNVQQHAFVSLLEHLT
jgi:L-lysine exporter family protein LysE/ArgO